MTPETAGPCMCVTEHRPPVVTFQRHHIVPKSWGGPDVATWNGKPQIVITCGTTHDSVHMLLNHWVRAWKAHVASGTTRAFTGPAPSITKLFTRHTQALARSGWANRPPGSPTPYTLSTGAMPTPPEEPMIDRGLTAGAEASMMSDMRNH